MAAEPLSRTLFRIVHCINGLGVGGAETALLRLIGDTRGRLAHTIFSLSGDTTLRREFEAAGAEVETNVLRRWALRQGPALRASDAPQVVQGWMAHGGAVAWALQRTCWRSAALAWNLRMPLTTARNEKKVTLWLTRALALASPAVDLLIANTASTLDQHIEAGYRAREVRIIPNGFDTRVFRPIPDERARTRKAFGWSDDHIVVGLVGRHHPVKGHDVFLDAAHILATRCPEARFCFAGRGAGPDNVDLVRAITHRGLVDKFVLLGERRDVPRLLTGFDILCAPSAYESFPNAVAEGMASGLLCVSSAIDGIENLIGHCGIIVPERSPVAFAAALEQGVRMPSGQRNRLGLDARQRIVDRFSSAATAQTYEECYRGLPAAKARANGAGSS